MRKITVIVLLSFIYLMSFAQGNDTPYYLNKVKDPIIAGTGFMLSITPNVFKPPVNELFLDIYEIAALKIEDIPRFERWSVEQYRPNLNETSKAIVYLTAAASVASIIALPVYSGTSNNIYTDMGVIAAIYAEGILFSNGLVRITNTYVHRPKPFVYNKELPLEWRVSALNDISFFSGRTTFAFYNAAFVSCLVYDYFGGYGFEPWIYGAAFTLAGSVSALELISGERFLTDVIVGAAVGTLSAWGITRLHLKKKNENFSLIPITSPWYSGLACSYTF